MLKCKCGQPVMRELELNEQPPPCPRCGRQYIGKMQGGKVVAVETSGPSKLRARRGHNENKADWRRYNYEMKMFF